MDKRVVLVTGIGGIVGQGILRNIIKYYNDLIIVGTNTQQISAGSHLCDFVYDLPFSWEDDYIPKMKLICQKHHVELIIPSTDYEVYYLGLNKKDLPLIAASDPEVSYVFLNKYVNWKEFKKNKIPFANTCLPSENLLISNEYIIKPKEGRGSRGIYYNHPDPCSFSDEYIIQEKLVGEEITTAFYVSKKKKLHAFITFKRSLNNSGSTDFCQVVKDYDQELLNMLEKIISVYEIKGSANLQSIVTNNGVIPFELNCRISGTNSIRSNFGFEDVKYTIQEYLLNEEPDKSIISNGSAIRISLDIIYPNISINEIQNNKDDFFVF
jgi:carbamoyl-phosphate synthase large subunit